MIVKIYLVDDHKIFREGLKLLLNTIKSVKIIGEANNGRIFLTELPILKPDIVFMDINMKEMDGIEATQKALELIPDLKIIALTSFEDEEYFNRMTDLGVKGYLLKNSLKDDFEKAISRVMEGDSYYSDELIIKLSKKVIQTEKNRNKSKEEIIITEEEKVLLKYICQGLTNKQIADIVHLSNRTIEAHRARLLFKTNTRNSVALAVFAMSNKLVSFD
jgi:DNA-binding NarL/FixJ family response regulator